MNDFPRKSQPQVSIHVWLVFIILVSIALRLWGLDFGLPQATHPDEPVVVTRAQLGAATNDWNPRAFHWPSLQIYILGLEYKIWYWIGDMTGVYDYEDLENFPQPDRFMAYTRRSPSGFYYIGRLTTVLFSIAFAWIFFLFTSRFLKVPYALAATALVVINPILTEHSRYITPDIPALFFFTAALLFMDRLFMALSNPDESDPKESGPNRLAIIAAIMIGLGTGTKYPVAGLFIPLAAVILFSPSTSKIMDRVFLGARCALTVLVTFLLTTPYALLDWRRFIGDIETIGRHVREHHIGMQLKGDIWFTILNQFYHDSGWLWTSLAIIGLVVLFCNIRRTWPLLIALAVVLVGFAPLRVYSDRYLLPLIPFLVIGIGTVFSLVVNLNLKSGRTSERILVAGAVVAILVTGIYGSFELVNDTKRLTAPNTRLIALEWIESNIPPHDVIVKEQGAPDLFEAEFVPLVPEPWYFVTEITPIFSLNHLEPEPLDRMLFPNPDWVITSGYVKNRYMLDNPPAELKPLVDSFGEYYEYIERNFMEEIRFSPGDGVAGDEIIVFSTIPDTRGLALEWIEQNVPPHATLVIDECGPDLYSVNPFEPRDRHREIQPPEPWYYVHYTAPLWSWDAKGPPPIEFLLQTRPEWVITSDLVRKSYLRECAQAENPDLAFAFGEYYRLIDEYLVEIVRFSPRNVDETSSDENYDPDDKLMGPEIIIFEVQEGFWDRVVF